MLLSLDLLGGKKLSVQSREDTCMLLFTGRKYTKGKVIEYMYVQ